MCSTMSGEHETKRKRKKERLIDDRHAEGAAEEPIAKLAKKKKRGPEIHPSSNALAEAEGIPKDEIREKKKKIKNKKKKKLETVSTGDAELRSAQPEGTPEFEVKRNVPMSNKEEAEEIRARLGISAADPKSAQKRMTFQFSFSVPKPTRTVEPDEVEEPESDTRVQINVDSAKAEAMQRPDSDAQPNPQEEEQPLPPPPAVRNNKERKSAPGQATQVAREASGNTSEDLVPRRVYIGGMPFWYTEEQIRQCWGECGEIEDLTMMTFPDSGNFRGLAFITFATQEGYEAALAYNGDELEGKYLVVKPCRAAGRKSVSPSNKENASHSGDANVARSRAPKPAREAGGKKGVKKFDNAPERVKDYNVLFVGNVPWELTRSSVADLFREFKPKFVRMFDKPGTKQHKGFAHVHFPDEASVDKALSMNGASIMGRKLVVMYAQPSKEVNKRPSQDVIEDGM